MKKFSYSHFIYPSHENDHHPTLLHEHALLTIGIVSLLGLLISFTIYISLRETHFGRHLLSNEIIELTNEARIAEGLPPLLINERLTQAAHLKGEDMASRRYFAHYASDGTSPWYWIKRAGYNFISAGENLAINFTSSSEVAKAWMLSPSHRANIMSAKYQDVGVAIVTDTYATKPTSFVVQMFGSEQNQQKDNQPLSFAEKLLLHSNEYLLYGYISIAILLVISLLGMLSTEARKKHLGHIMYGFGMLGVVILCSVIIYTSLSV